MRKIEYKLFDSMDSMNSWFITYTPSIINIETLDDNSHPIKVWYYRLMR